MLAKNINSLFASFKCELCSQLFERFDLWKSHGDKNLCRKKAQIVQFAKGGYRPKKGIFQRLEELGYDVPEDDRYYPYRSTWDWESINLPNERIPLPFEPLERLDQPDLPLPLFRSLTAPEDFANLRIQYQHPGELWQFFHGNKPDLLTRYRPNGRHTVRLPYGSLTPNNNTPIEVLRVVTCYTHQLMARQKITYTLRSVTLVWADMGDPYDIRMLKRNILPKAQRVNTAAEALAALNSLTITALPENAQLISLAYRIEEHKHIWLETCIPISWSVSSNVNKVDLDGHNMSHPRFCVIPSNTDDLQMGVEVRKLVVEFYEYLNRISDAACAIMTEKFDWLLAQLRPKAEQFDSAKKLCMTLRSKLSGKRRMVGDETPDQLEQNLKEQKLTLALTRDHAAIYAEFLRYLRQLPAVAFNSSRFDINLIRRELFSHSLHVKDRPHLIKKNSQYMSVAFQKVTLLDCCNFMSAGVSLAGFLKAWGIEEQKGIN